MFRDAVHEALEAVSEMEANDPLREAAFQEVLRAALAQRVPSAQLMGAAPAAPNHRVANSDDPLERVAARLGITIDMAQRAFDFAGDGVSLTLRSNQLAASRSRGTEQIALLICAARQAGLGETETPADVLRAVCNEFGRLDDSNFAATLRGLSGLLILGGTPRTRTYRMTRPGFERARAMIESVVPVA